VELPRFWTPGRFRVFLSHLASHKEEIGELQAWLKQLDISAFVAHNDIAPTSSWMDEILLALETCQAVVAILREGFHESQWTAQELGYAMGRGLLIITVRAGQDPRGFVGKFQALSWDGANVGQLARRINEILLSHEKTSRILSELTVENLVSANSWERARELAGRLASLGYWDDSLSKRCRDALESKYYVKSGFHVPSQIEARIAKHNLDSI
jgi:hypothetical protein